MIARIALIAAAAGLSGCQTPAGDYVVSKLAAAVNRYCLVDDATRAAVRANVAPYLADGVVVTVTCPDGAVEAQ